MAGESTLGEGMKQQWQHMKSELRQPRARSQEAADALSAAAEKPVREQGSSREDGAGWMSHQNGRVTGTGVTPGAGDSEAGTTAPIASAGY